MLAYFALECLRAVRNPWYLLFTVGLPAVLYLGYLAVVPPSATQLVPTLAALGASTAATATAAQAATDHGTAGRRRFRGAAPRATTAHLATTVLVAMLASLAPIAVICLLARVGEHVDLGAGAWTRLVAGLWLGTLPFALLGLVLGRFVAARDVPTAVVGLLTLAALFGGLLIPGVAAAGWMAGLGRALPTYWIGEVGRDALAGATFGGAALVLAAWSVVAAAVVAVAHRRVRTGGVPAVRTGPRHRGM